MWKRKGTIASRPSRKEFSAPIPLKEEKEMKNKSWFRGSILPLVAVCLLALPLAACSGLHIIVGTGDVVSKSYDFKDFSKIEVSSAMQYEISQAPDFSVSVSARQNILTYVDVYQSDATLIVRMKPGSFSNTSAKATITLPQMEGLSIAGASKGSAQGFVQTSSLKIDVSGASQLDLDASAASSELSVSGASRVTGHLTAQDSRFSISGASRCQLEGSTGPADMNASGASRFDCPNLILKTANVKVSGASHAAVNTSGELNLEVTGASSLDYYGNPTINKIVVNGASQINKK
jgi:hypothetical protein